MRKNEILILHRVFFITVREYNRHFFSLELTFRSLLHCRQTSKWRFYTVWQFKTKGVKCQFSKNPLCRIFLLFLQKFDLCIYFCLCPFINWWKMGKTIYLLFFFVHSASLSKLYTALYYTVCTTGCMYSAVSPTCELKSQFPWLHQMWKKL